MTIKRPVFSGFLETFAYMLISSHTKIALVVKNNQVQLSTTSEILDVQRYVFDH